MTKRKHRRCPNLISVDIIFLTWFVDYLADVIKSHINKYGICELLEMKIWGFFPQIYQTLLSSLRLLSNFHSIIYLFNFKLKKPKKTERNKYKEYPVGHFTIPIISFVFIKGRERERERAVNFKHVTDHTYQLSQFRERERARWEPHWCSSFLKLAYVV